MNQENQTTVERTSATISDALAKMFHELVIPLLVPHVHAMVTEFVDARFNALGENADMMAQISDTHRQIMHEVATEVLRMHTNEYDHDHFDEAYQHSEDSDKHVDTSDVRTIASELLDDELNDAVRDKVETIINDGTFKFRP